MQIYNTPATKKLCDLLRDRTFNVSLREHCLPLMQAIADGNEVLALATQTLARALQSRVDNSNGIIEGGVILLQDDRFLLVLRTSVSNAVGESEYIEYPSSDRIFLNCSTEVASMQTFAPPNIHSIQEFESGLHLEANGLINVPPGSAAFVSGSKYAVDVGAALKLANISLYDLREPAPLRWAFDKKRLTASFLSVGDRSLSALKTKIDLLGWLGSIAEPYQHYISTLQLYVTHRVHVIRWAAIQSICAIDFEQGLIHLKKAIQDEHPEIQRAAARVVKSEEGYV